MKITVADTLNKIDPQGLNPSQLIVRNTGSESVYFAWEEPASAAALHTGAAQGVPLKADEMLCFAESEIDLNGPLHLVCASGESTTLNYTYRT